MFIPSETSVFEFVDPVEPHPATQHASPSSGADVARHACAVHEDPQLSEAIVAIDVST
jgi:hypothetical protein